VGGEMNGHRVDIGDAIRFGWEVTKANLGRVVVLTLAAVLAEVIPSQISKSLSLSSPGLASLFSIAGSVITVLVSIGVLRISLRLHDGQPVSLRDLFIADWSLFWRFVGTAILFALIIGIGLILLVIPGIILGVRYRFCGYFVVDRNARPLAALTQSAAATNGVRWQIFLLGIVLFFLNVLGALLLGVGLLVTAPLSYIAWARVYRTLTAEGGGTAPQPAVARARE
jgi:uncharacterized membrane protein